jgi:TonB family protein
LKRKFLRLPEYPGGKTSFEEYIRKNQVYPEDAVKHNVSGTVFLSAVVDDNGCIHDITVENGIGFGCDEEAIRLLRNIHFGSVKNPGVRVKTRKKFRIPFRMRIEKPNIEISYTLKKNRSDAEKQIGGPVSGQSYSYRISWGNNTGNPHNPENPL